MDMRKIVPNIFLCGQNIQERRKFMNFLHGEAQYRSMLWSFTCGQKRIGYNLQKISQNWQSSDQNPLILLYQWVVENMNACSKKKGCGHVYIFRTLVIIKRTGQPDLSQNCTTLVLLIGCFLAEMRGLDHNWCLFRPPHPMVPWKA
jgi:hypothetical protein